MKDINKIDICIFNRDDQPFDMDQSDTTPTGAQRESGLRMARAIEAEGLTLRTFVFSENQTASSPKTLTSSPRSTSLIENTLNIFHFIRAQRLTVFQFLFSFLHLQHGQLSQYRTDWRADNAENTGLIIRLLNMIKDHIYSSGNGPKVWKLYIYSQVSDSQSSYD